MPWPTQVRLKSGAEPVFPDSCLGCGEPQARYYASIKPSRSRGARKHSIIEVPACATCSRHITSSRRWFQIMEWAGIVAVFAAVYFILDVMGWMPANRHARKWLLAGLGLAMCIPLGIWNALHPPPIDVTASAMGLLFEFRDAAYAREFARLNGVAAD